MKILLILCLFMVTLMGCKKFPLKIDLLTIDATVLGKENCEVDSSKDYFLLDLIPDNNQQIGDTLHIDGKIYNHVVKAKLVSEKLRPKGSRIRV
jgi:hypothetical protein